MHKPLKGDSMHLLWYTYSVLKHHKLPDLHRIIITKNMFFKGISQILNYNHENNTSTGSYICY